ncbi:hypothetical protein, partial [Planobispora rosea]
MTTSKSKGKMFIPAGGGATAPTADEALAEAEAQTAGSPEVKKSRSRGVQTSKAPATKAKKADDRTAFTWRLTPEQIEQHDELMLRIRKQTGQPRLDKATVLDALVTLAEQNQTTYRALI